MATGGESDRSAPEGVQRSSALAVISLFAGIFTVVFAVAGFVQPDPNPPAVLSSYQANQSLYAFGSYSAALFGLTVIPYFAVLGTVFWRRANAVTLGATLLVAVGISAYVIGWTLGNFAVATASTIAAPSPAVASYQAGYMYWTAKNVTIMGLVFFSLGFALFGCLAWNSRILPNWLAVVGIIGGISGLLIFNVIAYDIESVGFIGQAVIQPAALAIWAFASVLLFTRGPRSSN